MLDGQEKVITEALHQSLIELRSNNWQHIWIASLCMQLTNSASLESVEEVAQRGARECIQFNPILMASDKSSVMMTGEETAPSEDIEHTSAPVLFSYQTNPPLSVPYPDVDMSKIAHPAGCDGPQCAHLHDPIKGARYKCSVCEDVDFCSRCVRDPGNPHDRTHIMLKTLFVPQATAEPPSVSRDSNVVLQELDILPASTGQRITEDPVNERMNGDGIGYLYTIGEDFKVTRTKISADRSEMRDLYPNPDGLVHHANTNTMVDAVTGKLKRFEYPVDDFHRDVCSGIRATRVIDLCPGSGSEELRCTMRSIRLDDPPPYNALSYTWKETSFERSFLDRANKSGQDQLVRNLDVMQAIYVGQDRFIPICNGLRDALRRLRHSAKSITLWVDQLCINQQNLRERSLQVQYMDLIYNRARRVFIWTGDSDSDSKAAIELIEKLAPMCRYRDSMLPPPARVMEQLSLSSPEEFKPLLAFFTRPVFGRAWVLQEIILAQNPVVRCGEYEIEWGKVAVVANLLCQGSWLTTSWRRKFDAENRGIDGRAPARVDQVTTLRGLRHDYQTLVTTKLAKVMYATRFFEVTRPEDRVYAVLGIRTARPQGAKIAKIAVNYEDPLTKIYTDTAKAIIVDEEDLSILAYAGITFNELKALPSWVADWSSSKSKLVPFCSPDPLNRYRASGDTGPVATWPQLNSPNTLQLRSYRVGVIKAVGTRMLRDEADVENLASPTEYILEALRMSHARSRPYPGETDSIDALLCTLLGNSGLAWSAYPAPAIYKSKLALHLVTSIFEETPQDQRDSLVNGLNLPLGNLIQVVQEVGDFDLDDTDSRLAWFQFQTTNLLRRFITTDTGYFGLGPAKVAVGDEVHILSGAYAPFVFRRLVESPEQRHILVGDAYVHGIMNGEALSLSEFEWGEILID